MRTNILEIFFMLLAIFGLASSLVAPTPRAPNSCEGDKTITGYCDMLNITDRTAQTANPPKIDDCLNQCRSILSEAGDWSVDFAGKPSGYIDIKTTSGCRFAVGWGQGEPLDYTFFMDNQDMVNIYDAAVKKFGGLHNGRVAAEGTMVCQGHQATWFIY